MADQEVLHTVEVMKAALPYIDERGRGMAEFFTKILDLMGSLRAVTAPSNLAACGYERTKVDMEGLLNGIRPICNKRERDFIDRILNIFNIKRMYEMYNNFMSTMKTMQEFGGFSFGDSSGGEEAENIAGNFSGMNFESIFGNFNKSSENKSEFTKEDTTDYFNSFQKNASEDNTTEAKKESGFNGLGNNKMFFEMLKTMVPPEQVSTFENLSMLLNTMSYDNNSKPDVSEENKDG